MPQCNTLEDAAGNNHIDCFKRIYYDVIEYNQRNNLQNSNYDIFDHEIVHEAVLNSVECMKFIFEQGYPRNPDLTIPAAVSGITMLKLTHQYGCQLSSSAYIGAIENCNTECIEYLYNNNCTPPPEYMLYAVDEGNLNYVKFGLEKNFTLHNVQLCQSFMLHHEHRFDHFKCIRYLLKRNYPKCIDVCNAAAAHCHINCLIYAHKLGYPCNRTTVQAALRSKSYPCVAYLIENNCPFDMTTTQKKEFMEWGCNRISIDIRMKIRSIE